MTIINRETFQATETEADGCINGTVEITVRGETRRVPARLRPQYGWIFAYGIVGRYQTGGKAWPASVHQDENGKERVHFGREDNHPKFRKENAISFASTGA